MNLHRVRKKADWEKTPKTKWSPLQRFAARTNGIATPANLLTLIGLSVVLYGIGLILQAEIFYGIGALVIGRLLDIADGVVADKTATKSSLGELLDAVTDKIATILIIGVLFFVQVAPWWVVGLLVVPQLLIMALTFYKKQHNQSLHPSFFGKISMALLWVSCIGLLVTTQFQGVMILEIGVYGSVAVSIATGMIAFSKYCHASVKWDLF